MGLVEWVPGVWDWINDNGGGLGAVSAIATAVVAIIALQNTAQDSRDRARPMVLAELRPAADSHDVIMLVVRNAGPSVARDVSVGFDPEITLPEDTSQLVTPFLLRRYERPIPSLAPGQELLNVWFDTDHSKDPDERGSLPNAEPIPDVATVQVAYRGTGRRLYTDTFRLDVDVIRMMTFATSSDSVPGRLTSIHRSLLSLSASGNEIALAARYLRRGEIEAQTARRESQTARLREQMIRKSDQT